MTIPTSDPRAGGETHDLRRTFKTRGGPVEAVRGVDLDGRRGRDLRLPRPERRRARRRRCGCSRRCSRRAAARPRSPAPTSSANRRRSAERIGYVAQGGRTDPAETGRGELVIQGRLYGMDKPTAEARAAEVLAALDLESAADRPTGTYSGGSGAASTSASASSTARAAVPRRADDRPRPAGAGADVGRDPRPPRERHDRLPHDPLSRGGRRAGRPAGDHRPRQDRRRGHSRRAQAPGRRRRRDASASTAPPSGRSQLVRRQPFVREASGDDDLVRLYVDHGETAVPPLLRVLDGAGLAADAHRSARPSLDDVFLRQTGRSLRDEAGMSATVADPDRRPDRKDPLDAAPPRHLARLPSLALAHDPATHLGRVRHHAPAPLPRPVRAAARRRVEARPARARTRSTGSCPGCSSSSPCSAPRSSGFGLIAEMRNGVIERMRVTPMSRTAMLLGRSLRDVVDPARPGAVTDRAGDPVRAHGRPARGSGRARAAGARRSRDGAAVVRGGAQARSEDALAPLVNGVDDAAAAAVRDPAADGARAGVAPVPEQCQPVTHAVDAARALFNGDWGNPGDPIGVGLMTVSRCSRSGSRRERSAGRRPDRSGGASGRDQRKVWRASPGL